MIEIKDVIRQVIMDWPGLNYDEYMEETSNPDYVGLTVVNALVEDLYAKLNEVCTDLTPVCAYPKICAYCSRPAMDTYG